MAKILLLVAFIASASAAANVAFVGGGRSLLVARRPLATSVSAVEMRAPKASNKLKGAKIRSSVSKRMKVTAGGKVLRRRANKQHLLTNKKHKNNKANGKIGQVSPAMAKKYLGILQQ